MNKNNYMKYLGLLIALLSYSIGFSQINELRKAQDARENVIGSSSSSKFAFNKLDYVNPFIGTGGHGHTYPGASAPFGMIQLSPDTRHDGWDGCSGYHYSDSIIYGFSHTHLSGTGVSDYGDLLIVPQNGKPRIDPGYHSKKGYGSLFSHDSEEASPGYYGVKLLDNDIDVRLTVSERAGMHEYTFNKKAGKKFILIDLDHRDKLLSTTMNILSKTRISGSRTSHAWATEQHFYFDLELNTPYQKARIFKKNGRNKLLLIFPKSTKQIKIRVGISAVSAKGARLNRLKEISDWDFEKTLKRVQSKWTQELNKVLFRSKDKEVMTNFYTAMYHSFLNPNVFSDVDGQYRGFDNKIHQLKEGEHENYTVFSLWDTYRATHPLFTLTQTKRTNAFINTFLRHYQHGGDLPVWELAGNETNCMIGYHSASVIADAYAKGLYDYDAYMALEAMLHTSNEDEVGKKLYATQGFLGVSDEPESVSKTLEYAYDDFCIYQMLKQYSIDNDDPVFADKIDTYLKRSMSFVNVYDPSTGFMRGRRSGQWFAPFKPAEVNFNYTEANSWQYSLYAPHAVGVLRDLIGGHDAMEKWLDDLFTTQSDLSGRHQVDITGLIGQYAHGNEPSHHMAYLYNYTNAPHKTQVYLDQIMKEMYSNTPDGLSGNEDCGQMSSWYVLSAMGIYQIAPGRPVYEIGRPLLDEAMIQFESGKKLTIKALNNSSKAKYVQSVSLNGKILKRSFLTHSELIEGGKLVFTMSEKPNTLDTPYEHAPTLNKAPENFIPTPFIKAENRVFDNQMTVEMGVIDPDKNIIFYTTDGSDPLTSKNVSIYTTPFEITESTTIKAYAADSIAHSTVINNELVRKNNNISIEIRSEYANQYAAYGDFTIIDGIKGSNEYRTGDWQGYWDQSFEAVVSFTQPVSHNKIGLGFLSDMKSWIFLPNEVELEVTYVNSDGQEAVSAVKTLPVEIESDMYPHRKDLWFTVDSNKKIKQIKVIATPTEVCPEWHLGNGNPTWIFIDEIIFK
jgi:predicted alpha-1,2-mannosidase